MKLTDTVKYFTTEIFTSAFDVNTTFNGKINPFAEVTNSGSTASRRILETEFGTSIPAGRVVISPAAEKYIVANKNIDFWGGSAVRAKYPILPVSVMGSVGSVSEVLADSIADEAVYCYPFFARRIPNDKERSDYFTGYELYFSSEKTFIRSDIVVLGGDHYRLTTDTWIDSAGYSVAQSVKLEDPMQDLDFVGNSAYNPVTDTYTLTTISDVTCLVEYIELDYVHEALGYKKLEVGDRAISFLKSEVASCAVGDSIGDYEIMSVDSNTSHWQVHGRKK